MIKIKKTENGLSRFLISVSIEFDVETIRAIVDSVIVRIIIAVVAGLIVALVSHLMLG